MSLFTAPPTTTTLNLYNKVEKNIIITYLRLRVVFTVHMYKNNMRNRKVENLDKLNNSLTIMKEFHINKIMRNIKAKILISLIIILTIMRKIPYLQ